MLKKLLLLFVLLGMCSCQPPTTVVVRTASRSVGVIGGLLGGIVVLSVVNDYQKEDSERLRRGKCPLFDTLFGDCDPRTGGSYGF